MSIKHTPGFWTIADDGTIESQHHGLVGHTKNISCADKLLIAAAPQMLKALKDISDAYQKHFDVMPVAWETYNNIVNEAIALAIGE